MILGHNNEAVKESVIKACENGLSFGCATEVEVDMAEFICEMAVSTYRAGADIYLTYFAKELAGYMAEGRIG